MSCPQQVLSSYDNTVDDEFERLLSHGTFHVAGWRSFLSGAVSAWAPPMPAPRFAELPTCEWFAFVAILKPRIARCREKRSTR